MTPAWVAQIIEDSQMGRIYGPGSGTMLESLGSNPQSSSLSLSPLQRIVHRLLRSLALTYRPISIHGVIHQSPPFQIQHSSPRVSRTHLLIIPAHCPFPCSTRSLAESTTTFVAVSARCRHWMPAVKVCQIALYFPLCYHTYSRCGTNCEAQGAIQMSLFSYSHHRKGQCRQDNHSGEGLWCTTRNKANHIWSGW